MDESVVKPLLEALKQADPQVRDRATTQLWQLWFRQKGLVGLEILERSQRLLAAGAGEAAVALLTQLLQDQPDFAEAWNRRAVLYFTRGEYQLALEDCLRVLELVPYHFGALHGLGLCYSALGDYRAAIRAFRQALEIQPYALMNQRLILECTARLD